MRVRLLLIVATALVLAAPGVARAHVASLTHSRAVVDGAEVHYRILAKPADLAEALGRAPDDPPDDAAVRAGAAVLVAYVTAHIAVLDGGVPCPAGDGAVDLRDDGGHFVAVTWTARCPAPIAELVIEYDLFFDLDPTHEAVLRVEVPGDTASTVLDVDRSRFVWALGDEAPSGLAAFLRSGVDHIATGLDHIAFVLALLLAIVITRVGGTWQRRSLGSALRATALIVTSFTVAHSLTLIAASLGWVRLPGQLVETVIALSIAYTAIENIVRPDVRWRFALTFGFGLLHGLGFARMLEVMLPPDDVVLPLLAFNLGVELGQLVVVAVALPLFWLLAGFLGADRYRRLALPALSSILATLGLIWLAERL